MSGKRTITTTPAATIHSTIWETNGIRLGHAISVASGYSSAPASSTADVVRMHFGLKGDYRFYYKQLDRTYDLIGGHHNIMYSPQFDMVVENKTPEIETFGIQFPTAQFIQYTYDASDILKRFADDILRGKSVMLGKEWGPMTPAIEQAIQQVRHNDFTGETEEVFLMSKSIELLVLCADACTAASERAEPFIRTKADKEKLIAVRDLINDRVTAPPNLSEIARHVGLNEYKLKRGFKETFHTTVFGYLTEQRLNLAQRYLRDTQKTAAEISAALGYATPQHFNNAFRKRFGVTPAGVRNNT